MLYLRTGQLHGFVALIGKEIVQITISENERKYDTARKKGKGS